MYFGMGVDCGSRTCGAVGLAERRTVGAGGAIGAVGLAEHRTVGAGCPLTTTPSWQVPLLAPEREENGKEGAKEQRERLKARNGCRQASLDSKGPRTPKKVRGNPSLLCCRQLCTNIDKLYLGWAKTVKRVKPPKAFQTPQIHSCRLVLQYFKKSLLRDKQDSYLPGACRHRQHECPKTCKFVR